MPDLRRYLLEAWKVEHLATDEGFRCLPAPSHRRSDWMERKLEAIREELAEHRALRAAGDLEGVIAAWHHAVVDHAFSRDIVLDRSTDAFRHLCREFNDASIEVWEAVLRRLEGDSVPTPAEPALPPAQQIALSAAVGQSFEAVAESILEAVVNL